MNKIKQFFADIFGSNVISDAEIDSKLHDIGLNEDGGPTQDLQKPLDDLNGGVSLLIRMDKNEKIEVEVQWAEYTQECATILGKAVAELGHSKYYHSTIAVLQDFAHSNPGAIPFIKVFADEYKNCTSHSGLKPSGVFGLSKE